MAGDTLVPLSTKSCDFSRYVIADWALGAKASKRMEVRRAAVAPRMKKRFTG
jgi:hypothetical protein